VRKHKKEGQEPGEGREGRGKKEIKWEGGDGKEGEGREGKRTCECSPSSKFAITPLLIRTRNEVAIHRQVYYK